MEHTSHLTDMHIGIIVELRYLTHDNFDLKTCPVFRH